MTRVIKVGGRPQTDPQLAKRIADSWDAIAGAVVVHGGGDDVRALQLAMGATG